MVHITGRDAAAREHVDADHRQRAIAAALLAWALGYAAYRAYYAAGGQLVSRF